VSAVIVATCVSCADDSATNAERFCGEIEANSDELFAPEIDSAGQIEPLLDLYRRIGRFAPLAIEADWDQLVLNYETASTVVPDDDDSVQAATAEAYQTERSAAAVKVWLRDNCAIDIGPISTIVAQDG